ncbi:MAG: hypothetical protein AAFY22_11180 [Pseudomonadota bacterium]
MSILFAMMALQSLPEAAFARHAPPSYYEALMAIQGEFVGRVNATSYRYQPNVSTANPRFPVDIHLFSCEFNADRRLTGFEGITPTYAGYDCIVDIYPLGNPKYQVYGFFYFTGLEWRYYGTLLEGLVIQADRYGDDQIKSARSAKEGAITYDGQPFGTSIIDNPYNDILDRYENPAARRSTLGREGDF